ncbi:P-loop containing nucleoside triphosphate hydrolase protein [Amylocarpus encephaloides]|uniref:P-loop containing nucleoside triphosphate hydrolase protein n=1 Tax=Amylocarpus encephaloides TaxID=45428 RepID=A0A9P7Y8X3_9HELO|nr:P-loop containing nucleoside triphosphate hydrolase protein [Amylocarpus encephaloides]
MEFPGCPGDGFFGPVVQDCRDNFDFTIKFERIFFSLTPGFVFIVAGLARIVALVRLPKLDTSRGYLLKGLKLIISSTFAALSLALLVFSSLTSRPKSLSLFSSVVDLISALCIVTLSPLEHSRSPRPSLLLELYLLVTLLLDFARSRTFWLASITVDEFNYCRLLTAGVTLKAVLLVLESLDKWKWVEKSLRKLNLEETSGVFGLSAFTWLNSLFLAGYKKILVLDDLPLLPQGMEATSLQCQLTNMMETSKANGQRYGLGLAKALTKSLAVPLSLPIVPRLGLIGFRFCQPFLIHALLDQLREPADSFVKNKGYGLIGATILIYCGISVSTALYWFLHERALCMSRGSLAGAIYTKTTQLDLAAADDAAAVTLMSTDLERIQLGFLNLHEFWANSIEVGLASWLLERQLGSAFAAPLLVVLCCISCATFTSKFTRRRQKAWMDRIQTRVGLTGNVISNMKHLKISGLAVPVEELIQNMRIGELEAAARFRTVYVLVITFGFIPMALSPVMTFTVTSKNLDSSTIFTSLSYLILLADPLTYIFQNIPYLLAAFTCLERIQDFLESNPRLDVRTSNAGTTEMELAKNDQKDQEGNPGFLVRIRNGNFGWEEDKSILKNINLEIPMSCLTVVVGPVASGKSTLCKVLLGEISSPQAQVIMGSGSAFDKVGYCAQTPYLSNSSIRESIVGLSKFDQVRYDEVIVATMLSQDISLLPAGSETKIGSGGLALSGGQKQRVSLARALYLETDTFIFDDILSGLDSDTEKQIFHRVFGPEGILRRRNATIVLCTHSIHNLPTADFIIALSQDGKIAEQGGFQTLIHNGKYVSSLAVRPIEMSETLKCLSPKEPESSRSQTVNAAPLVSFDYIDDRVRMTGDSTVHKHYLASLGTTSIVAFMIFGLGWGFFYNWGNVWLTFWAKDVSSEHPSRPNSFYIGLYAIFQVAYVASMFFVFLVCFRTMIQVSGSKLHKAALNTMVNAPLSFFATTDVGVVLNLFSQDMTLIDNELPIAVTNLALDICNALGMAAVIATASPFLIMTYPFLLGAFYIVQKLYLRTSRQLRLLDLEAKSPLYTHFLDTMQGLATFRAFGWIQDGIDVNNRLLNTSQKPAYLLAMVQRWLLFYLQVIVAILAIVVVTLATQLRSSTSMTGVSLVTLMTFGDILNYIMRWYTQIETSIGAVGRLKSFSDKVKPEGIDDQEMEVPNGWPLKGAIKIEGVSASYNTTHNHTIEIGDDDTGQAIESTENLALNDICLFVKPREKVGICGRSGSGKSSAILLLLKLLDPLRSCSDNIIIDDIPLHKINRSTLRQRIIAVPQDPIFLPGTTSFMTNLDPFNTATESDCQVVLKTVGLWKLVEERGGLSKGLSANTLSQGQKQLFNLARAILRRHIRTREIEAEFGVATYEMGFGGILLLDEISSSVDQETDRMMQQIILEEFKSYTIVMVSHRLEMMISFDTVLVMDKGSVVESGDPMVLKEQAGSRFGELWRSGNRA